MQSIIQLAGPFATVVASVTAGLIAIWLGRSQVKIAKIQAKTANDRLVLDLFDRRLKIFSAAREEISKSVRSGTSNIQDQFAFLKAIDGAQFLFDEEVTKYLNDLYTTMIDLEYANDEISRVDRNADRLAIVKRRATKFEKLTDFYKEAPVLFAPYLAAHQRFDTST